MYYAELTEAGIVKAVTQTAQPIELPHMIQIADLDTTLLGKRHVEEATFEEVV